MSDKKDDGIDDFLVHHGVKGMKWGVRRSQSGRVQLGAAPRRAHANRKAARQRHAQKIDERRQARVDSIIKGAGGNKRKAHITNVSAGLATSLLTGIVGRTAVRALNQSGRPEVAAGVSFVTGLVQTGVMATTAVNAIRIQDS